MGWKLTAGDHYDIDTDITFRWLRVEFPNGDLEQVMVGYHEPIESVVIALDRLSARIKIAAGIKT